MFLSGAWGGATCSLAALAGRAVSVIPGWSEGPDPESRDSPMCSCTSEVRADARPGMTAVGEAGRLACRLQPGAAANASLISLIGGISRTKVNDPLSFISRAHLRNAASATRDIAPPTLMRLTPAADS